MKDNAPNLTAAHEAIYLMRNYGTTADVQAAAGIRKAWIEEHGETSMFDFLCMLGAIYTAGRIEGIRSERGRRKE